MSNKNPFPAGVELGVELGVAFEPEFTTSALRVGVLSLVYITNAMAALTNNKAITIPIIAPILI